MTWYYAVGGRQMGPVDESALDDLVRQGAVRDDTLVWREGMENWQPHGVVRPRSVPVPAMAAPPPPPAPAPAAAPQSAAPMGSGTPGGAPGSSPSTETRYCSECGRPFPAHELSMAGGAAVCSTCRPVVMQRMAAAPTMAMPMPAQPLGGQFPGQATMGGRHYGGFWIRFVARVIDAIILGIAGAIIRIPLALMLGAGGIGLGISRDPNAALAILPAIMGLVGLSFLIQLALGIAYEVYFDSTRGGTPGKLALGLKIVRTNGNLMTPGQALGRYFAMWLSAITLMIGYIIAGFDSEKRALHDHICDTRVIYAR
jgi:uncharacterized RDD family membrane protein YckC